jgi:HlyD family secretion protein
MKKANRDGGAVLVLAGALGYGIWQARDRGLPEGLIQANGRLEGDSVLVASKYPGRLERSRCAKGIWSAAASCWPVCIRMK